MKTFRDWADEKKYDLNVITDAPPLKGSLKDEKAVRTGQGPFYPPAYKSGQYPPEWFAPTKATWAVEKQQRDAQKGKIKADAGNTPLS